LALYCTVAEVRNWTNVQAAEWGNGQIALFISGATKEIDARTGRTWQGTQTATEELYDGNGSKFLKLKQMDIAAVSYLGIDDDNDDVFTQMSSNWYDTYLPEGIIKLNASATPGTFVLGNQTVKVTYTYGTAAATDDIKALCMDMVADFMNPEATRTERIKRKIIELKQIGADMVNMGNYQ